MSRAGQPGPEAGGGHGRQADVPAPPAHLSPLLEAQLVEAAQQGDREALGRLLIAHQHRLYGVCYRMLGRADDASDLTHDALVRIMEGIGSYDGRSRLSTWMIRIAMNGCLSHLRRRRIRRHGSLDEPGARGGPPLGSNLPGAELSASGHVEQAERHDQLLRALASLDPPARAILVLRDVNDLEYQQIAEVLDVPVGTVKSRLFRAREALRHAAGDL